MFGAAEQEVAGAFEEGDVACPLGGFGACHAKKIALVCHVGNPRVWFRWPQSGGKEVEMVRIRPIVTLALIMQDDGSWICEDGQPGARNIRVSGATYSEALANMGPALREKWFLPHDPENA